MISDKAKFSNEMDGMKGSKNSIIDPAEENDIVVPLTDLMEGKKLP